MYIFLILVFILCVVLDLLRLASAWSYVWYVPPMILLLASVFDKETTYKYVLMGLVLSGLLFDVFSQELFGTNGIVLCTSLIVANLVLRTLERSPRKTVYKTVLVSALYVILRTVVW